MIYLSLTPFPSPPASNAACGFPTRRLPANFLPKFRGPIFLGDFREGGRTSGQNPSWVLPLSTPSAQAEMLSLPFGLHLSSQVLSIDGWFYHTILTSRFVERILTVGPLGSTSVTSLHHYYAPIRHPLTFDSFTDSPL